MPKTPVKLQKFRVKVTETFQGTAIYEVEAETVRDAERQVEEGEAGNMLNFTPDSWVSTDGEATIQ